MKGINIFLAEGFEDVEAIATADVLRRGGVDVHLVSMTDVPFVVSSHGTAVGADCTFDMLDFSETTGPEDVMIFPGGMPGTRNLAGNKNLIRCLQAHYADGGAVAAICAAPGLVLSKLDDLQDIDFTCYDGFQDELIRKGAIYYQVPAIRCGRVITGRSAAHAIAFGLEILRYLRGDKIAAQVKYDMDLGI